MTTPPVRVARFDDLTPRQLYGILRLRSEIFVVEQECVFLDPDGRDHEPHTEHLWCERDGAVVAALRLLSDPGGVWRISRVVVAADQRGHGTAGALVAAALERVPAAEFVLDAQAHLVDLYARHGFVAEGDVFVEDGIPHQRMRRGPLDEGRDLQSYVRTEAADPDPGGRHLGVFALLRGLRLSGRLSPDDEVRASALVARSYALHDEPAPEHFDTEPRAISWYIDNDSDAAGHLQALSADVVTMLAEYGITTRKVRITDPGRITYRDDRQVVAVPRPGL